MSSSPSFHTPDEGRQKRPASTTNTPSQSSLAASLRRINDDSPSTAEGSGLFSFLTPWKNKRKREEEVAVAPNTAPAKFHPRNGVDAAATNPAQRNPVDAGQSNRSASKPRSSLDGISTSAIKQAHVADRGANVGGVRSTKLEGRFEESARKRVRVSYRAETTPRPSGTASAAGDAAANRPTVGFASSTTFGAPRFQPGTGGTPAKTARGRRGTPVPNRGRGGSGSASAFGGGRAATRASRPRIVANFRPMSRYLTSASSKTTEEKRLALNQSLASQILSETQGKLITLGLKDGMFGEEESRPRTFAEEAVAAKRTVPRVRMTRVLGSGQSGGLRVNLSAEEGPVGAGAVANQAARDAAPRLTNGVADASTGFGGKRKAPVSEGAIVPGVLRTPVIATGAVPPASAKKAVTFTSPTWAPRQPEAEEDEKANDIESEEPFVYKPMPKSGSMPALDPVCKDVPRPLVESLVRQVNTPDWQAKAKKEEFGLGGPDMLTPTPAKKKPRTLTPHPKKAEAAAPNLVEESTKTPFNFMPKSDAASTPAYRYKDVSSPKPTPVEVKTPSKSAIKSLQKDSSAGADSTPASTFGATPAPAPALGWGNMFAAKPGEWQCTVCLVKNAKEESRCMACETEKPSDGAPSGGKTPKKDAGSAQKKVDEKASIGAGGFSFGGQTQSSSTGNIGAGGFSFGGAAAVKPPETSGGTGGFSFGGASAKPAETTETGFFFGGASAPKPAESTGTGFTFGASASKPSEVAATPSTDSKPSTGFSFGTTPSDKQKDAPSATTPAVTSEKDSAVKSEAAFSFGLPSQTATTEAKADDAKPAAFAFGSQTPAKKPAESSNTPAFSFSGAQTDAPKNDTFTFGAKTPSVDEKKSSDAGGAAFSFGQGSSAAKPGQLSFAFGATTPATTETKAAPGFSFGGTATPAATAADSLKPVTPAFSFGGATATTPAAPTANDSFKTNAAAFSFGGSTTPAAPTVNDASKSNTAAFSFGGSTTPAAPTTTDTSKANTPAFSFGGAAPAPAATSNATFSFGSTPASTAPTVPPTTTPGVSFGGAMASTPAPSAGFSFGGGAAATGFGSSSKPATAGFTPAAAPAASAFTFGGPPTTPATGSFGMPPNNNAPLATFGFGSTPAAAPSAGGFGGGGFGAAPATTPAASSFGGGGFGAGATPSATTPGGGFSIGTSEKKSTGRRILKARRPPK